MDSQIEVQADIQMSITIHQLFVSTLTRQAKNNCTIVAMMP